MGKGLHILKIAYLSGLILSLCTFTANAEAIKFTSKTGSLNGHTTYQIGSINPQTGHFPLSEIKFDMAYQTAALALEAKLTEDFSLEAEVEKNLSAKSGYMEDSDWIQSTTDKDIYSKSNNYADYLSINTKLKMKAFTVKTPLGIDQTWHINLGYKDVQANFNIIDGTEFHLSSIQSRSINIKENTVLNLKGNLLQYTVKYHMPYIEWKVQNTVGGYKDLITTLAVNISPWVWTSDRDLHVLRKKTSIAQGLGHAYSIMAKIQHKVSQNLVWNLEHQISKLESSGTQHQSFETSSRTFTKDHKIKAEQSQTKLGLTYIF